MLNEIANWFGTGLFTSLFLLLFARLGLFPMLAYQVTDIEEED